MSTPTIESASPMTFEQMRTVNAVKQPVLDAAKASLITEAAQSALQGVPDLNTLRGTSRFADAKVKWDALEKATRAEAQAQGTLKIVEKKLKLEPGEIGVAVKQTRDQIEATILSTLNPTMESFERQGIKPQLEEGQYILLHKNNTKVMGKPIGRLNKDLTTTSTKHGIPVEVVRNVFINALVAKRY